MSRVLLSYRYAEKSLPYLKALQAVGLEPVLAKPGLPLPAMLEVQGVVLSGGNDLNPARYGQPTHEKTIEIDDERDAMELQILKQALALQLPVLCICRGMQLMNVYFGGTLFQDIPDHAVVTPKNPGKVVHEVGIAPSSKLREIFEQMSVGVNSRHHQAVDRLGIGLNISAIALDGTIEGIELEGAPFVVGVQWHPEDQVPGDAASGRLFAKFASAVQDFKPLDKC